MEQIITRALLNEVLKVDIININIKSNIVYYNGIHDCGSINIHELAIKIVDKITALGYVASLTKIKTHWWCEFATENYYKNNGDMSHGNINSDYDIDTKSDDVLSCAVKAYGWILENKKDK